MPTNTPRIAGRHFLQIPGPTPVPDRILRAMDRAVIDHRGPEFQKLGQRVLSGIKSVFQTKGAVFISSATMDPDVARRLAKQLEATGRLYLDAPISGGAATWPIVACATSDDADGRLSQRDLTDG